MLNIRKINPMVRAIGTMGAVAALVGGITFAAQTSNTVMLTDNTLASTTASLAIGNAQTDCNATGTTATGMTVTALAPGATSSPFNFCLDNTGTAPLSVSMTSPTNFSTSAIPANDVTLNVTCNSVAATPVTLNNLTAPTVVDATLAAGTTDQCSATVTLSNSYNGSGGSITPFELDFVGTSTST